MRPVNERGYREQRFINAAHRWRRSILIAVRAERGTTFGGSGRRPRQTQPY